MQTNWKVPDWVVVEKAIYNYEANTMDDLEVWIKTCYKEKKPGNYYGLAMRLRDAAAARTLCRDIIKSDKLVEVIKTEKPNGPYLLPFPD